MGTSVGERRNVQTRGGNRVSTISLLGCSTSVALTMGPTDEEKKKRESPMLHVAFTFISTRYIQVKYCPVIISKSNCESVLRSATIQTEISMNEY